MILFVCTGNTCRSPMAMALARARGVEAESAGIMVYSGSPASREAILAVQALGGDLSGHFARPVSEDLMARASRVWAMTRGHQNALLQRYPQWAEKICVFSPEIADPFGGDGETYLRCARQLLSSMEKCGILAG